MKRRTRNSSPLILGLSFAALMVGVLAWLNPSCGMVYGHHATYLHGINKVSVECHDGSTIWLNDGEQWTDGAIERITGEDPKAPRPGDERLEEWIERQNERRK